MGLTSNRRLICEQKLLEKKHRRSEETNAAKLSTSGRTKKHSNTNVSYIGAAPNFPLCATGGGLGFSFLQDVCHEQCQNPTKADTLAFLSAEIFLGDKKLCLGKIRHTKSANSVSRLLLIFFHTQLNSSPAKISLMTQKKEMQLSGERKCCFELHLLQQTYATALHGRLSSIDSRST